jgi:GAF domain-containing protein
MIGRAHRGMDDRFLGSKRYVSEDIYTREILDDPIRAPRICKPLSDRGIPFGIPQEEEELDEWACIPFLWQGKVIGKLSADNKFSHRPIAQEELESLTRVASQAAEAIAHARSFSQAKSENLRAVLQLSTAISSPLKLDG